MPHVATNAEFLYLLCVSLVVIAVGCAGAVLSSRIKLSNFPRGKLARRTPRTERTSLPPGKLEGLPPATDAPQPLAARSQSSH